MIRSTARLLALFALLALPAAAQAQGEPPHTKETKAAEKSLGLALLQQDAKAKRPFLMQALEPLRVALQKNSENGRAWMMLGTVHAGLGDLAAADSAFDRAVQLHPGYAEQIDQERHVAWEGAYLQAVELINAQKPDEGMAALRRAEVIYDQRPEAKFYLGLFHLQREEVDQAAVSLNAALAAVDGPLVAKLSEPAKAEWVRMGRAARLKLANIESYRASKMYDRQQFDSAAATFRKARSINPISPDPLLSELHSVHARALDVDKERAKTKSPALNAQAQQLNASMLTLADTLKAFDPGNLDILFFSSRAHKVLSDLATDPAVKARHLDELRRINVEYEKTAFGVGEIRIAEEDSTATITTIVQNKSLKAGATGTLKFELLDYSGNVMGSAPATFTVPATDAATAKIEVKAVVPITGPVAGWRYRIGT